MNPINGSSNVSEKEISFENQKSAGPNQVFGFCLGSCFSGGCGDKDDSNKTTLKLTGDYSDVVGVLI